MSINSNQQRTSVTMDDLLQEGKRTKTGGRDGHKLQIMRFVNENAN